MDHRSVSGARPLKFSMASKSSLLLVFRASSSSSMLKSDIFRHRNTIVCVAVLVAVVVAVMDGVLVNEVTIVVIESVAVVVTE